jgi:hypothetical protein
MHQRVPKLGNSKTKFLGIFLMQLVSTQNQNSSTTSQKLPTSSSTS